ncbi:hypothetical protein LTR08_001078 [Meristemomyces frigidus]|nr:hypothetical protein LTR08_001078 [Meristemomyces frigidus]
MPQNYTFSPVTATDRAGVVWVAAILSLLFSVLTLITRFHIKSRTLGLDDWLLAASNTVAVGQYIAIYTGLSNGLGVSSTLLQEQHARTLGTTVLTSEVLLIVSLGLCKMSVVCYTKRLFTREYRRAWRACNAALALSLAWTIGSALAVSVGCGPAHVLWGAERCPGNLMRWMIVNIFDGLLEIAFIALAIVLVWPLQMTTYIKVTVVSAFAFRICCAVVAVLHGVWFGTYVHSSDPGLAIADVLVWQQVELGYALISATIPILKGFVRGYNSAMGFDLSYEAKKKLGGGYNLESYGEQSRNRSAAGSRGRSKLGGSRLRHEGGDRMNLRPNDGDYQAGAYHEPNRGGKGRPTSTGSGNSEDPIIRRDISVTVEHSQARTVA